MSDRSNWERGYPVRQSAEHNASRRQFFKFAGTSVLALLASAAAARSQWFRSLFYRRGESAMAVAEAGQLEVGESKMFFYPTDHDPCILIHVSDGEYSAFSQKCTHLMCPVHYSRDKHQIVCPCHNGFFAPDDGRVLAGPPPKPLPRFPVEVRDGKVWVTPD